ncbi:MAG TPA: Rieske (2Fe-2S) protein [Pseudonocardiaceae bacterium]|jgi:Rieske Fe-S protein
MPNRRQVLCGLMIGLLAPGALVACTNADVRRNGLGDAKSGAVLAKVGDIAVGGGALVNSGTTGQLLLCQPSQGVFTAYDPTCTHLGNTVDPPVSDVITCPAHGSQFNAANGDVERGPAETPLASVKVKVSGQNVVLA